MPPFQVLLQHIVYFFLVKKSKKKLFFFFLAKTIDILTKKIYYKVKERALIRWRRWFSEKNFIFLLILLALTGCKSGEKEFDEESLQNLKETAQSYLETELQNGDVRLNEYISLKGEIVESDSRSSLIKKVIVLF